MDRLLMVFFFIGVIYCVELVDVDIVLKLISVSVMFVVN